MALYKIFIRIWGTNDHSSINNKLFKTAPKVNKILILDIYLITPFFTILD